MQLDHLWGFFKEPYHGACIASLDVLLTLIEGERLLSDSKMLSIVIEDFYRTFSGLGSQIPLKVLGNKYSV